MQLSNTYIIVFTAIMTIIIGGALSLANQLLKPAQTRAIKLDTRTQILNAVMDLQEGDDILAIYDDRIDGFVVNISGDEITADSKGNPILADKVNIIRNFKKKPEEREYPVFKFTSKDDPLKIEAYIFPVYGNGLWNNIFGFVALESDLNTIKGVSFGHVGETPGLGARITESEIEDRYIGKKIFDNQGKFMSVTMLKGEKKDPSMFGPHEVDGMSGATITARGLNAMLKEYLHDYEAFIKKIQRQEAI